MLKRVFNIPSDFQWKDNCETLFIDHWQSVITQGLWQLDFSLIMG